MNALSENNFDCATNGYFCCQPKSVWQLTSLFELRLIWQGNCQKALGNKFTFLLHAQVVEDDKEHEIWASFDDFPPPEARYIPDERQLTASSS